MVVMEPKSAKIPELTVWNAEQRTWTTAKRELTTLCQNNDMDCIIDAAQAVADHIQAQYDPLRSAASAGTSKPKIKTRISEFTDSELVKIMSKARNGDIVQRVTILKLGYLSRELSRDWNNPQAFALSKTDEGRKELAKIHEIAHHKQLRIMNQNFIIMLQRAWIRQKGNNRQQERLRGILFSRRVQDLLDGNLELLNWPTSPWLWVAVDVLSRILLLYEGVAEAVDGNFIADVARLLSQTTDPSVLSVHEADQNMERLLLPLKQNFTTLADFLNYMRACVQAEIIARMATGNTPEGKAWEKAHSKLVELRQESSSLTLDMVLQVVKLAENHLARIESRSTADASDAGQRMANATQVDGMEQQIAMQATTITDLEKKLAEYSARSADTKDRDPATNPRRQGRGRSGGGRGGSNTYGKRKASGTSSTPSKHRRVHFEDRTGKQGGDRAPPTCTVCGKLHRGTCLMERDLDKEQRDLDNARRHKEAISRPPAEAKYVQRVRELESDYSNEDESNYLASSLAVQALHTATCTTPTGSVIVAMRDPCLDSGSPVDITGVAAWTEDTGGTARLAGVTGNTKTCTRVRITYPLTTESGRTVALRTNGPGLYMSSASDNILSLALLMQAGHHPVFKVGTQQDPEDGGVLYLADGDRIRMRFKKGIWRLPVARPDNSIPGLHDDAHLDIACNMKVSVLLLELSLTEQVQVYHNAWGHPSNSVFARIVRHRKGKGFPRHFQRTLRKFTCRVCGICKAARTYRRSKRVEEAQQRKKLSKRLPPSHPTSAGTLLPSRHITATRCNAATERNDDATESDSDAPASTTSDQSKVGTLHLDTAYGIKMGIHKEKYYLLFVLGETDFTWAIPTTSRKGPEHHLRTFLTLTRAKVRSLRVDGEFAQRHGMGQGDSRFGAYCHSQGIVVQPAASSNHTSQARAEGAVRITKEHMRCLMKAANAPARFWPWALEHFCRVYNHWNVAGRLPPWTRLHGHDFDQNLERDIQVWGCYCTGHLPREHPLVIDATNDDHSVEGVFLGWDTSSPTAWIWSVKYRKEMRMADPQFHSHLFPFLDPQCLVNAKDLPDATVVDMHATDAALEVVESDDDGRQSTPPTPPSATPQSQQSTQPHRKEPELNNAPARVLRPRDKHPPTPLPAPPPAQPTTLPVSRKRASTGQDTDLDDTPLATVPDKRLASALVQHKVPLRVPAPWWIHPDTGQHCACTVLPTKRYNEHKRTYVDCDIVAPTDLTVPTDLRLQITGGQYSVRDLLDINFNFPQTLRELGIGGRTRALASMLEHWRDLGDLPSPTQSTPSFPRRSALAQTPPTCHEWRDDFGTGPFEDAADNLYWSRRVLAGADDRNHLAGIDILEPDPKSHRQAMKHPRLRPFWESAEDLEMDGLWTRGCLKRVLKKTLSEDERQHVFRSKFHYKIKRSGRTGKVTKCKARLVVMGNTMTQGEDYFDAFAPVPRATAGRLVMSLTAGGRRHIHSLDITQAFIQSEWQYLPEGIPSRIFILPPDGVAEEAGYLYEICKPLYGIPNSARALHFTLDNFMKSQGFVAAGFEDSVWVCNPSSKYAHQIIVSAHIDDLLVSCAHEGTLTDFKQAFLKRFDGTDDGPLTEYLGCEVIRSVNGDITLRQAAYSERILRTYDAWGLNPVKTPLEPGKRLTKQDSPSVIDPDLHRRYRGFVGHLSFLVQMTRPDLAFAFSELSKFIQAPGIKHWLSVSRTLQYLRGTYNQGITYSDPGLAKRNVVEGWVDSDFAADPDTRRSVTGYVLSLNNGPVSWKSKRQACTTLSSAEAEFVAASICGQELIYVRALMDGLGFTQKGPTTIWEDNAACIAMSENPTHADRARHIDTRIYFLRDMVRDGIVKLRKVPGTENVADALTKSLPAPSFEKHREYLWGSSVPFSAFWATLPDWQNIAVFKIDILTWNALRLVVEAWDVQLG